MEEVIGLIAGACTTLAFLPQVMQVWRTKSARDISLGMYIVFCCGVSLWFVYGFMKGAISVMLTNALTLVLAFTILGMKVCWGNKDKKI
ncbi:MAG: SemiSWEET transporter [Alphaproteobacteria bacterium]|nr:SemiSWEET transporter [Alphaproteobacteria bacterium]